MPHEQFQKALGRLVNDEGYRATVEANPRQLVEDYTLNEEELKLLGSVWQATGAAPDVTGYEWYEYCCCCCCC